MQDDRELVEFDEQMLQTGHLLQKKVEWQKGWLQDGLLQLLQRELDLRRQFYKECGLPIPIKFKEEMRSFFRDCFVTGLVELFDGGD